MADVLVEMNSCLLQESLGYKEALVSAFETVPGDDWNKIASWENLNAKKSQVSIL